jgi:hypothetical protein
MFVPEHKHPVIASEKPDSGFLLALPFWLTAWSKE